jgi:hypothetical protein
MNMQHTIVSQEERLAARKALLVKEKEFTAARDQLSEMRRVLPWVKIEKNYIFDGPAGKETLADLFGVRTSCWYITSCSAPAGGRAAQVARSWRITSMEQLSISRSGMCRWRGIACALR